MRPLVSLALLLLVGCDDPVVWTAGDGWVVTANAPRQYNSINAPIVCAKAPAFMVAAGKILCARTPRAGTPRTQTPRPREPK